MDNVQIFSIVVIFTCFVVLFFLAFYHTTFFSFTNRCSSSLQSKRLHELEKKKVQKEEENIYQVIFKLIMLFVPKFELLSYGLLWQITDFFLISWFALILISYKPGSESGWLLRRIWPDWTLPEQWPVSGCVQCFGGWHPVGETLKGREGKCWVHFK